MGHAASDVRITPVAEGLRDPMEIAVAKDGDVYIVEREGRILRVRPRTGGIFEIGQLKVAGVNAADPDSWLTREDGLLGIALDPKFDQNRRLFLYYSDPQKPVIRLSRFTLKDGVIDPVSELKLLEVATERAFKVSHQGGSLAFSPDGLLFLSTGDNTNPFESLGHAPLDMRDGRDAFDSSRSAANTNDLRGKILRIRPTETGYEIPAGNLFPPGTPKTRPEIYAMGCRNPFRISINPKTGTLYWGDVGPDALKDTARGPTGYDEVNQAKKPGNFGWPLFIGNNFPYPWVDFATGKPTGTNDPAAPKNIGVRNTGLTDLPPAQPAFIWYPYASSREFPALGAGTRSVMAGPVFFHDPKRPWNLLDAKDDASLLIYDWSRGRMWKAKLDPQESLQSIAPLADNLRHPMDLEMGADGLVWLLEYGSNWYLNRDGRLRSVTANSGNRAPEFTVLPVPGRENTFTAAGLKDPDHDRVDFHWFVTEGADERDLGAEPVVTVPLSSARELRGVATDGKGAVTVVRIPLDARKTDPPLALNLPGKPASLASGESLAFEITSTVPPAEAMTQLRVRYIPPTGHDAGGPQLSAQAAELIAARACVACHSIEQKSIGPRFLDVSLRFRNRPDALTYLRERLKNGSQGDWGEVPMPPQAALTDDEAQTLLPSILALSEGIAVERGKLKGVITLPAVPPAAAPGGEWEILAETPDHLPARLRLPAQ